MRHGTPAPVAADPCLVVGELASLLAGDAPLPTALDALVRGLQLRAAVLRSTQGELLGVAGATVRGLPSMRAVRPEDGVLEFAVGAGGVQLAVLSVQGARPSQAAALRSAAAVLGLALRPSTVEVSAVALLDDREAAQTAVADALHDGPVQSMLAARYAADAVARGGEPELVRHAVQQAVVELRRQIWQLRPRGQAGLVAALSQLSERLVEMGRPALLVPVLDDDIIGPGAETAYRLVQELALGQEAQLAVSVSHDDRWAVVEVAGAGPLSALPAWGRRATALGGSVTAAAGRITLRLPAAARAPLRHQNHARTSP